MDEQTRREIAKRFFDDITDALGRLYDRYRDEAGYEDFRDYGIVISPKVAAIGGVFVKMTGRPFGFIYILDVATYHVFIRGNKFWYKRTA